jgi:hypothetical protein
MTCTEVAAYIKKIGGKQRWSPKKLGKKYVRVDKDGDLVSGNTVLIGVVPGEDNQWVSLHYVSDDQIFQQLRNRPFYAPCTLWFEMP